MSTDSLTERSSPLVGTAAETLRYVGSGIAVLAVAVVLAGLLGFANVLPGAVAGVALVDGLATALGLGSLGMVAVGLGSRAGAFETTPDRTAGLLLGVVFGLVGLAAGGLVAAQTLGLSTLWPVGALVGAAVGVGVALGPREDVALAATGGGFGLVVAGLVLAGVLGPGWSWQPAGLSGVFRSATTVPLVCSLAGLVLAWTAAQASAGFGPQGKARGASLLVGANAAGMIALLVGLVSFIAVRGVGPMLRGIQYGLFWEPITWFQVPFWGQYVVVEGPVVWFHWPFTMVGFSMTNPVNGVAPAIVGTAWLVIGAVLLAVPLGVGTAVFLTEYAEQGRLTALVEVATNGLWSTPSIVYGLFGLAFLVPRIANQSSLLSGMIVLGFMLLPLVIITSREALLNVPDEYRDASVALGVSRWETIKTVVLPAAMPGVITGTILGVGRIAGETAPILLVLTGEPFPAVGPDVVDVSFGFTSSFPFVSLGVISSDALLQPSTALPYQLFATITAGAENVSGGFQWATALVLLLVVFAFYAVGIASRSYFQRKLDS